jgi:hypothetical protein
MREGNLINQGNYIAIDGYNMARATFEIGQVNAEDVEKIFKASYRHFYLDPIKLVHLLSQIRSISELKWFIRSIIQIFIKNLL